MISAVHAIVYTKRAGAIRRFFKEKLRFKHVDAGDGWLLFALPPAELGVHPTNDAPRHEIALMCEDIRKTVSALKRRGVRVAARLTDAGWGLLTYITLPDKTKMLLYEPRHASPLAPTKRRKPVRR